MWFSLTPPKLLIVAAAIGILLWWDLHRGITPPDARPWAMTGTVLVALAMLVLVIGVKAPLAEQALRIAVLLESLAALWLLERRGRKGASHDRR